MAEAEQKHGELLDFHVFHKLVTLLPEIRPGDFWNENKEEHCKGAASLSGEIKMPNIFF